MEVRAEAHKASDSDNCSTCGLRFLNDWERLKHEVVRSHHYRAWNPQDGLAGMAARKPTPPVAPPPMAVQLTAPPSEKGNA